MTSLREAAGGRPVDRDALADAFVDRLEPRVEALRGGRFDVAGWAAPPGRRPGAVVDLEPPGRPDASACARSASTRSRARCSSRTRRPPMAGESVVVGEIRHVRLAHAAGRGVTRWRVRH